eukprot:Skav206830  [mRNA]  locus=scaffold3672:112386:113593:+ [translate_table: standard]
MARSGRVIVPALFLGALALLSSRASVFVPPPATSRLPTAAVAGAALALRMQLPSSVMRPTMTYPIAKKTDWGNTPIISYYFFQLQRCGKGSGCTAAVAAHDKALDSAVKDPNLVTSKADFAAVNEALARMRARHGAGDNGVPSLVESFHQQLILQAKEFKETLERQIAMDALGCADQWQTLMPQQSIDFLMARLKALGHAVPKQKARPQQFASEDAEVEAAEAEAADAKEVVAVENVDVEAVEAVEASASKLVTAKVAAEEVTAVKAVTPAV